MRRETDPSLAQFYDSLWQTAEDAFAHHAIRVDPHLRHKDEDRRRGLSLILRPEGEAVLAFEALVRELRQIEPHQYFYERRDYHVTVLSPLTATVDYQSVPEQLEAYVRAIARAAARQIPLKIDFHGITATPEAVMIQGFPANDCVNQFRECLRQEWAVDQLPLQQRYPPRAAHVTLMRFARPCDHLPALADYLRSVRDRVFGACSFAKVELVENDWYMSADKLNLLATFGLGFPRP
jgi:2'-5' RNA ligase